GGWGWRPRGGAGPPVVPAVPGGLFSRGRIADAIEVVDEQIAIGPAPAALRAQRALLLVFAGGVAEGVEEAAAGTARTVSPAEEVLVNGQLAMLTSMLARHDETVGDADRALEASGTSTTLQLQAPAGGAPTPPP